jgi:hypothetical protein
MADSFMKSSIKHNKLRNTGILFELLVRQITSDVMENKKDGIAVKLMREFFNSKKELGKELMLYRAFFNVQNVSEQKAFQLSIYKNFDSAINGIDDTTTIEELASSQFTIVEHLSGKFVNKEIKEHNELSNIIRSQDDDIRFLAYKILIERFNEKYKGLDDAQKKLLQEYIYNISNTSKLKTYTQTESRRLAKEITQSSIKVKDKVTRIKLGEVVSQLQKVQTATVIKENHMTAMLIAYEILKELKAL